MSAIHALLGFTAWTLLLIATVFVYRALRFLGGTPINHWPRREKPADDAPIIGRIEDAHANCLENLPAFAVIVLAAFSLGRVDAVSALAPYVLYARFAQTAAHLSGVGPLNVLVRSTFWSAQLLLMLWMLVKLFA